MSWSSRSSHFFAGTHGYADEIPVDQMMEWQEKLLRNIETTHTEILKDIAERKELSSETEMMLRQAIDTFNRGWLG